ncbi:adenosine trna methylthiotransferase [Rhypophila decipiens]|uniref:Adenosine trna methylthiotransferase n=1 Tax=Rhypophila decipiens TaxID=261697 RepID=A0AAN6YII2_9PEZI|nr:adenosine trna methylthiotransferase [Rhypophila decipiens]
MATTTSLQPFQALDDTGRWIIHKAPDVDPAWGLEQALEKHKLPPVSERLKSRKKRFQTFIQNLLSSQGDPQAYNAFRSATSWEDVRQEAEQAVDQYVNQGKTWNNPFRRTKRLVGSTATRLEFLTQLIPNGDYLGVLCGGLKLAYSAANRNRQLREVIIGALESLDSEISFAKILIREYAWDENIRKTSEDLYVAILDAVEAIMVWIEKRKGFRGQLFQAGKAIALQNDYGSELETQVSTNIKEKVEAFERAVRTCLTLETRAIATNVVTVGKTIDIIDGKIEQTVGELRKVTAAGYTVENLLRDVRELMVEWVERDRRDKELLAASQDSIRQMLQAQHIQRLIADVNLTGGDSSNTYPLTVAHQPPSPRSSAAMITVPQILQALNLAHSHASDIANSIVQQITDERQLILNQGRQISSRADRILSTVLQDEQFKAWLSPNSGSSVLLLNGSDLDALNSHSHNARISPFSYLTVQLAGILDVPSIHTALFFCHLHSDATNTNDVVLGPVGLLRSVIAQIILQHPVPELISQYLMAAMGHNPYQINNVLQAVQYGDIPSLCTLLDTVLNSFTSAMITNRSSSKIICFIDGASFFETGHHIGQMDQVMQYLASLVNLVAATNSRGDTGLVFKLLITSPSGLERGRDWFPYAAQLHVSGGMGTGELLGGIEGLEADSGVLWGLAERAATPNSLGPGEWNYGGSWGAGGSSPAWR